jgi:hypothetical protein
MERRPLAIAGRGLRPPRLAMAHGFEHMRGKSIYDEDDINTQKKPRGLAPYSPYKRSRVLLDQVRQVLETHAKYLPLTVRQVFYRMVAEHGYPKSKDDALYDQIQRARRAGLLDFRDFRDETTTRYDAARWVDPADMVDGFIATAKQFRFDRQRGQDTRLIFMVESAGMVSMVAGIANRYGIDVQSSGGFDSTTEKYEMAIELCRYPQTEILHIGDHDPSGVSMYMTIKNDVTQFAKDLWARDDDNQLKYEPDITVTRLALTEAQIEQYQLETQPRNDDDKRNYWYTNTVQCEALPPNILVDDIIEDAIKARMDIELYAAVKAEENEIRRWLPARLSQVNTDPPLRRRPLS